MLHDENQFKFYFHSYVFIIAKYLNIKEPFFAKIFYFKFHIS